MFSPRWLPLACLTIALSAGAAAADDPKADPPRVEVSLPVERKVAEYAEFTGRTLASAHVDIKARVTGFITKSSFKEGAEVKAGEVLFELDANIFQAEVERAQAMVELAKAQLDLAKITLKRNQALRKTAPDAVSQDALDQSEAAVAEGKARLLAEEKTLDKCKLNLEFTKITSPINGRIGRRLADPGQLVIADTAVLASVENLDPLKVYFDMDEKSYLRWQQALGENKSNDKDGKGQPIMMGLATEKDFPRQGKIEFSDNGFDANTGTLRVYSAFPNSDRALKSGMFVRVRLPLGEPHKALLIAERAVLTDKGTTFVLVAAEKGIVERRVVEAGTRQDDGLIVIQKGLKPDELVVHTNLQSLRPGMTVVPKVVPMPTKSEE